MTDRTVEVLYDGQCPVCTTYCKNVVPRDKMILVDARLPGGLRDAATAAGLDLDKGFVIRTDGETYYGSEAMRKLVSLKQAGWLERVAFRHAGFSRLLYYFLKTLRNTVLRLIGVKKIRNLGERS